MVGTPGAGHGSTVPDVTSTAAAFRRGCPFTESNVPRRNKVSPRETRPETQSGVLPATTGVAGSSAPVVRSNAASEAAPSWRRSRVD